MKNDKKRFLKSGIGILLALTLLLANAAMPASALAPEPKNRERVNLSAMPMEPKNLATPAYIAHDLAAAPLPEPKFAEDRVLVKLAAGTGMRTSAAAQASAQPPDLGVGFSEVRLLNPSQESNSKGASIQSAGNTQNNVFVLTLEDTGPGAVERALEILNANPLVEIAEPNYYRELCVKPNDPGYYEQWALQTINAEQAWDITKGSKDVVVGIIDTGIDGTHPDLVDNLWVNPNPNQNGYVNDIYGYDFAAHKGGTPTDGNGHGTHVAGIVGAKGNNAKGVSGINWDVSLAWLGVSAGGDYIDDAACIEALNYANNHNIPITNNSYGGSEYSEIFKQAIKNYKGLFIAAAGNDSNDNDEYPAYPASYDLPNVISVGAMNAQDNKSGFSNYGKNSVHIAAPGEDILSTLPGNGYDSWNGTSMASPYVAGVAALVKAANPSYTAAQVKAAILNGAEPLPQYDGLVALSRRLDAWHALVPWQALESISVTPGALTLDISECGTLTAEVLPAEARQAVYWESSDPETVMVFQDGTITGLKAGMATITVRPYADPTKSASATVTVTGVDLGAIIFKDINFKQGVVDALKELEPMYAGYTIANYIYPSDAQKVSNLEIPGRNIADMEGIQYFTALWKLHCSMNQVTSLDISKCTKLEWLFCDHNQLARLDVSQCTELTRLRCDDNQLTSLDVTKCPKLEDFTCGWNHLRSLDVRQCPKLGALWCDNNQLTSLDVRQCPKLVNLTCEKNQLTNLDVSKCPDLWILAVRENQLESLDLSACTKLETLYGDLNQMKSLDVSNCTILTELYCQVNQLTSLDVSNCPELNTLWCCRNQLKSLDVSNCTKLSSFSCHYNRLTSLDISRLNLYSFVCYVNPLAYLNANVGGRSVRLAAKGPGYVELYWVSRGFYTEPGFYAKAVPASSASFIRWTGSIPDNNADQMDLEYGKDYSLTAHFTGGDVNITTPSLPAGKVGTAYTQTLKATGDAPITWSAAGLPGGLSISAAGVISGTPNKAGTFTVVVTASNGAAPDDTKTFSIVIAKADQAALAIQNPGAKMTGAADFTLTATGGSGTGAVTYTQTGGTAGTVSAAGLVHITGAGVITVTATKAGDTNYNPTTSAGLTITVTSAPADKTALRARIAELSDTQKGKRTNASWEAFENALEAARAAADDENATQAQVDGALNALNTAFANLQLKMIFTTRYVSSFWNWFKFFALFGWIWMWFI